jgi:type I restriction enzyme M protein
MSSQQSGEGDIRKAMIEADAIDAMVALPGQLFYSTQIPACLWILARDKSANGHRDRHGQILFIDARNLGSMVDRVRREFRSDDIEQIAGAYHRWRNQNHDEAYEDIPGFCKSALVEEVRDNGWVLTPGRYVGSTVDEVEDEPFEERLAALRSVLVSQFELGREIQDRIARTLGMVSRDG